MWRRAYLLLMLARIYFALSPSYLHPDENFQGPEIIAGELFSYPVEKTWEWTSSYPIRSVFPLWPVYGIPMILLKWVWAEDGQGQVSPEVIYYALRMVMFILSFVLEDWAIYELVQSPRHRSQAVILVASSYVTWTYQSHTFSNSFETLLVAWSLVLIERIAREKNHSSVLSCTVLSFVMVLGIFNRITFPAFILIPGLRLLPHFLSRPTTFLAMTVSAVFFICFAIATDTGFYHGPESTRSFRALFRALRTSPVITPWNNIRYNSQTSNLALHGLHPRYQHFLINLPQLLGPALVLLFTSLQPFSTRSLSLFNPRLLSALTGTAFLSIFPHQEPRFLLPCIPLLLTCVRLPTSTRGRKWFWTSWLGFNLVLGALMGVYHQGGIIPAQIQVPKQIKHDISSSTTTSNEDTTTSATATVYWWKTYPPPTYLLGTTNPNPASLNLNITISTVPLMGLSEQEMLSKLSSTTTCTEPSELAQQQQQQQQQQKLIYLIGPLSSRFFPPIPSSPANPPSFLTTVPTPQNANPNPPPTLNLNLTLSWTHATHLNLDDIDIPTDGLVGTLARVLGRKGIGIWRVRVQGQSCP